LNPDVIVAGELFVDLILSGFDFWPQPGQEAFARGFRRELGGAAITACGLAKLGTSTAVFGVVGKDTGEWVAERLRQSGVDTRDLLFDSVEPTAFSVAISRPEDRTLLTFPVANRLFPAALEKAARSGTFSGARHVHLACAPDLNTADELLRAIGRDGCSVSLDVGWHEDWLGDPRALALLPLIDVFFPNEAEARRMVGENMKAFAAAGARAVALKLGPRGAMLLRGGEIVHDCSPLVTPVDTVGAGDCFDAGFLHFWLRGASPATCLRAANFCGAASTEALGGLAGFPDADRVLRELDRQSCEK
jgi:ribokinase